MRFAKIPAIFVNSDRSRDAFVNAYLIALDSRITFFKENSILTMHLFIMLFSLQFHEDPTMVGLKRVNIVCSPMLSISKLTYFK